MLFDFLTLELLSKRTLMIAPITKNRTIHIGNLNKNLKEGNAIENKKYRPYQ